MKLQIVKKVLVLAIAPCLFAANSFAQDARTSTYKNHQERSNLTKTDDIGVGIKWGTLSGVSAKYWSDENQAWELTAAFADSNTAVGLDYLWNFRGAATDLGHFEGADNVVPFVGFGLLSSFGTSPSDTRIYNHTDDNFNLAARIPLGIEYMPSTVHLGIFGEIGLGLGFVPTSYTFATADVGARYYF